MRQSSFVNDATKTVYVIILLIFGNTISKKKKSWPYCQGESVAVTEDKGVNNSDIQTPSRSQRTAMKTEQIND